MKKTALAELYRKTYGYEIPTRTLARIMYKDHALLFKDMEDARNTLRYIEGKTGKKDRIWRPKIVEDRPINPFNIPVSYEKKREPFHLPKGCDNILVLSDLHIPYHNIKAIEEAIYFGKERNINTIILLGDVIDNHQISHFEGDPNQRDQVEEFDICKNFLRSLRAAFPNAHIYWTKGNHCMRWEKFLLRKAREIFNDPYFTLEERLRVNEERIHVLDDKTIVKAGNLHLHHGHHLFNTRFAPANPCKALFDMTGVDFMCGHLHVPQSKTFKNQKGLFKTFINGCLSELSPDYNPFKNQYQLGFSWIKVNNDDSFVVEQIEP
jgi:predicted phosphodiesterase